MALTSFRTRLPLSQNHPSLGPARKSLALSFGSDLHSCLSPAGQHLILIRHQPLEDASSTPQWPQLCSIALVFSGKESAQNTVIHWQIVWKQDDNTYVKRWLQIQEPYPSGSPSQSFSQWAPWHLLIPTDMWPLKASTSRTLDTHSGRPGDYCLQGQHPYQPWEA